MCQKIKTWNILSLVRFKSWFRWFKYIITNYKRTKKLTWHRTSSLTQFINFKIAISRICFNVTAQLYIKDYSQSFYMYHFRIFLFWKLYFRKTCRKKPSDSWALYANITYMYPNIIVIQLFTQYGTKFDMIIGCASTFVRYYVQYVLAKFWNRFNGNI